VATGRVFGAPRFGCDQVLPPLIPLSNVRAVRFYLAIKRNDSITAVVKSWLLRLHCTRECSLAQSNRLTRI
jgi:hypothetical protein